MAVHDGGRGELAPGTKLLTEAGPLLLFFIVNAKWGIFAATAAYMVAAALALAWTWWKIRRLALMPILALGFVLVFGGLTIWLRDATFIKMKVTLINALFGGVLLGGLYFDRLFLKTLMGEAMTLSDTGWRLLSRNWGLFFLFLAGLNEIVWRTLSTDAWVNFKVFGLLPLTLLFALLQAPLMVRHQLEKDEERTAP